MKYIGFKHQRESKQNSDNIIIKDVFLKLEDVSQSSHLRASLFDEMTEKRPLILKKTSLITYYKHKLESFRFEMNNSRLRAIVESIMDQLNW
jgi:hypothetical protein